MRIRIRSTVPCGTAELPCRPPEWRSKWIQYRLYERGYRVPRMVADPAGVRPIDPAIVDGVESICGGEGVWNPNVQIIKPAAPIAGRNPVCVDAVGMAGMDYDPKPIAGRSR